MKKHIPYQLIWLITSLFFLGACEERKTKQADQSSEVKKQPVISSTPTKASSTDTLSDPKTVQAADAKIEVKTFQQSAHGWGYDVYLNDKLYIHQPHIPAIGGNQGFRNEATARKTAKFIEWKIRHNIIPPSITPEELDSLQVL